MGNLWNELMPEVDKIQLEVDRPAFDNKCLIPILELNGEKLITLSDELMQSPTFIDTKFVP